METPESIRTSLVPGEWVSSIDLSDAYLHIPIHLNSRKYLRFCHRSQVFQFTSLPFGLATAPRSLQIIKEVKLTALSRGLRLHQYLDDWLIRSQSQEEAQVNTQAVVDLTQSLRWIINHEKSELEPTQVFSFVGYKYHLDSALVKPTQERWLKLQSGSGPEALLGSDPRPERVSVPPFHLLQERTYLRHQTCYTLFQVETNHSTLL